MTDENYYEARLTLFVKGCAPNRDAFYAEVDKLLDEWQLDSETTETDLTWDDITVDLCYVSTPNTSPVEDFYQGAI